MTIRNWTPLTRTTPTYDKDQMRITIAARARLLLNETAFNALRRPEAVAVFYDQPAELIGVVPVPIGTPNSLRVRRLRPGRTRAVSLLHFFSRFGLKKPDGSIVIPNPTFDPDGTMVLNYRKALGETS